MSKLIGNVKQPKIDPTGGMSKKNRSVAYDLIHKKDFAGLKDMFASHSATSEFFKHFSVKALANTEEHNNSAGAVPQLMQIAGFKELDLLETAKSMAETKIQNGKLDKAHNYVYVVMQLAEEVGNSEDHKQAIQLRDRVEYLKTEASKKAAAEFVNSNYYKDGIPHHC